ncbi:sel1 repeat family protein [Candidatus Dependentiae bacterium]|nr:sel1 repeat family protein [Candidatus Dependentiae bacterium]
MVFRSFFFVCFFNFIHFTAFLGAENNYDHVQDREDASFVENDSEEVLSEEVEVKDVDLLYSLGMQFFTGSGCDKSLEQAYEYFMKAAQEGHLLAQLQVARMLERGLGVQRDAKEAFSWTLQAAEKGLRIAQENVATSYLTGIGVTKDEKAAAYWYEQAAQNGSIIALKNLGYAYGKGFSVEHDEVKATFFFRRAAELGDVQSQEEYAKRLVWGIGCKADVIEALCWFSRAAAAGSAVAQCYMGKFALHGCEGVLPNEEFAVYWFELAAAQENPEACYLLGIISCEGQYGLEKKRKYGIDLIKKSAKAGNINAQRYLVTFYSSGDRPAYKKAFEWRKKAAAQGDFKAQHGLGRAYEVGLGCDKDIHLAIEWYKKAANQGYVVSMYCLAKIYQTGSIVDKNLNEALFWFKKATACGDLDAKEEIEETLKLLSLE